MLKLKKRRVLQFSELTCLKVAAYLIKGGEKRWGHLPPIPPFGQCDLRRRPKMGVVAVLERVLNQKITNGNLYTTHLPASVLWSEKSGWVWSVI